MEIASRARPHLDELDRLRILTALSVVAVHVVAYSTFLDRTTLALQVQNGFVTLFHFTREVFMFVTALALVYVYYGKPFSAARFWKRRSVGVLVPYICWTVVYVWVNPHPASPLPLAGTLAWDLLTGSASYQLYYILLTLEFYLLFPWFLAFLRRVERYPWRVLGISFALEVALLYAGQHALGLLHLPAQGIGFVGGLLDRFVLAYQFYFVLGAFVALHLDEVRAFLLRHGAWVVGASAAGLVELELRYAVMVEIEHAPLESAVAVLQPIMAFYSLAVIAFLYWLTYRRSLATRATASLRGRRIWRRLSDASFGVYLVHPLILGPLLAAIHSLASWPVAVLVASAWLVTAAASIGFTVLLLHIPLLSRLVGRASTSPLPALAARVRAAAPAARTAGGWAWPRGLGRWTPTPAIAAPMPPTMGASRRLPEEGKSQPGSQAMRLAERELAD